MCCILIHFQNIRYVFKGVSLWPSYTVGRLAWMCWWHKLVALFLVIEQVLASVIAFLLVLVLVIAKWVSSIYKICFKSWSNGSVSMYLKWTNYIANLVFENIHLINFLCWHFGFESPSSTLYGYGITSTLIYILLTHDNLQLYNFSIWIT